MNPRIGLHPLPHKSAILAEEACVLDENLLLPAGQQFKFLAVKRLFRNEMVEPDRESRQRRNAILAKRLD